MNGSSSSVSSFCSKELNNFDSNQRFYAPEEFKQGKKTTFKKKFILVCSNEYFNNNKENTLTIKEVRRKLKDNLIPYPNFDDWFNRKCKVVWDDLEKKLVLRDIIYTFTENGEDIEKDTNFSEITDSETQASESTEQIIKALSFDENANDNYEYSIITPDENSKTLMPDENILEENSPKELLISKSQNILKKKDKKITKENRTKMKRLKAKFKKFTKSPIEDASFEIKNVIGHRICNDKLELKIQWADDKERRVKYKPTYESASLCSCGSAIREYNPKIFKMYSKIKRRGYQEKKIEMSKVSKETKDVADNFFEIIGKTSKKF